MLNKQSRKYAGDPWAAMVTKWLNGEQEREWGRNSKPSRGRVLDLIATIQSVMAAIDSAPFVDLLAFPPRRLSALIDELNARLYEYPATWSFLLDCDRTGFFENGAIAGTRPAGESLAANAAVELAKRGLLERVKECRCKGWFFAKFAHQHFCSERCRKKDHESSEEFRAARREYMRRYYRLTMSGKVK